MRTNYKLIVNAQTGRRVNIVRVKGDGEDHWELVKTGAHGRLDMGTDHMDEYSGVRELLMHDAETWASGRQTNTELLVQIMEFARSGPLMQAFIIDALTKHADAVAKAAPEQCDTPLVNGKAWQACGVELRDLLTKHYGN